MSYPTLNVDAKFPSNIQRQSYSVKTDFSPAEPPAYYPDNPPAGGPPAKNHEIRLLPSIR